MLHLELMCLRVRPSRIQERWKCAYRPLLCRSSEDRRPPTSSGGGVGGRNHHERWWSPAKVVRLLQLLLSSYRFSSGCATAHCPSAASAYGPTRGKAVAVAESQAMSKATRSTVRERRSGRPTRSSFRVVTGLPPPPPPQRAGWGGGQGGTPPPLADGLAHSRKAHDRPQHRPLRRRRRRRQRREDDQHARHPRHRRSVLPLRQQRRRHRRHDHRLDSDDEVHACHVPFF
jgi:hypothetical protein